jgi:hypothetical protein
MVALPNDQDRRNANPTLPTAAFGRHHGNWRAAPECRLLTPLVRRQCEPLFTTRGFFTMSFWSKFLRKTLVTGSVASAMSMAMLMHRSRREIGTRAAGPNAESHWLHGDEALRVNRVTWEHTALGLATHHASALCWGALYEALLMAVARAPENRRGDVFDGRDVDDRGDAGTLIASAVVVSAVAAAVDLRLVPERVTPGFQRRLSSRSVTAFYVAFGVGLAVGAALTRRR